MGRPLPVVATIAVLISIGLAGCSAAGQTNGAPAVSAPSTPIAYFQGKWSCVQDTDPDVKGNPLSKWTFDISENKITVSDSGNTSIEKYALTNGTLTISDVQGGLLQHGYKNPATAQFPAAIPSKGHPFSTTIQLPNGDKWGLTVAASGNEATVDAAEPQSEQWKCSRG